VTPRLRRATARDLTAVGALHYRSRAATYRTFLPPEALTNPTAEVLGRYWTERWAHERDDHLLTVAVNVDDVVGFSYVGPDDEGDPSTGLLYAIHCDPAEQGRGVGRLLMIDALATMAELGWTRAGLWVFHDNLHARRFYEHGGWTWSGTERDERFGALSVRQLRYARSVPRDVEPSP
jgi:GNAT superfamily N-acetyltransferase